MNKGFFNEDFFMGLFALVAFLAIIALILLLPILILMWAWNLFMPMMFGLPHIGLMHALALSILLSAIRTSFVLFRKPSDSY